MIKILFVCHGNICRSPMAEFVMKDLVRREGLEDRFCIESAATSYEEIGNPVYPPVRRLLQAEGIDCSGKKARHTERQDYKDYDYLIGMDRYNLRNMERIYGGDPQGKIYSLLSFTGQSGDVADPWYTDDFDTTWKDVTAGCQGLLQHLRSRGLC